MGTTGQSSILALPPVSCETEKWEVMRSLEPVSSSANEGNITVSPGCCVE